MVVVKDGEVFFSKGYGFTDLESKKPVDPAKTLFRPGSISKLFTWTSIMQLLEQGKLSLDADVNTYLDFTIPATFPQPITLKNLMTHTPGFEDKQNGIMKNNPDEWIVISRLPNNRPWFGNSGYKAKIRASSRILSPSPLISESCYDNLHTQQCMGEDLLKREGIRKRKCLQI